MTTTQNATVTVTYKEWSVTFNLDGNELSTTIQPDGTAHHYLSNGSKWFIETKIEEALLSLADHIN